MKVITREEALAAPDRTFQLARRDDAGVEYRLHIELTEEELGAPGVVLDGIKDILLAAVEKGYSINLGGVPA